MIRLSFAAHKGDAAHRSHDAAMARLPAGSVGPLGFSGGKWVYTMMLPLTNAVAPSQEGVATFAKERNAMSRYQVSPALAAAVMQFAPKHVVLDDAPATFEDIRAYRKEHGVYAVWSGGSEQTIWPTPEHNYAFRALHDEIHDRFGHSFTIYGEQATARDTEKYLRRVAPHLTDEDYRAMWFEVVGQVLYEAHHGHFPDDQAAFIADCMGSGTTLQQVIQSRKY